MLNVFGLSIVENFILLKIIKLEFNMGRKKYNNGIYELDKIKKEVKIIKSLSNGNYLICDFDERIYIKSAYGAYDIRGTEIFICLFYKIVFLLE